MAVRRSFFFLSVAASHVCGFLPAPHAAQLTSSTETSFFSSILLASKSEDSPNSSSNETVVTKEMFLRDLLGDPHDEVTVKRKSKKGNKRPYKVLDNRDRLPFAVTLTTPDPYTHPDAKKQAARKNTPKTRHDAVEAVISSSLYVDPPSAGKKKKKKKGGQTDSSSQVDTTTWLGDFVLDKFTTTGDLLEIGDFQYRVVRHKCQYKYAGGKRFVMVRKILQVKEVGRLQTEEYLRAQWEGSTKPPSQSFPPEEA